MTRQCPFLMLWTAPAPGHRNAVDCLSQAERFKEVRQATTVAFEVEGIGEDSGGNADKVDPGIGTTRVGQRIFECVLPHKQAGHMTAPDQCCSNQKVLAKAAPSTHDPRRTWRRAHSTPWICPLSGAKRPLRL